MSPTADELTVQIKRDLEPGDVLVGKSLRMGDRSFFSGDDHFFYEVVTPHVPGVGKVDEILRVLRRKESGFANIEDCVTVAELTPIGRLEKTYAVSRTKYNWDGLIRRENRTDHPSVRER